MRILGFKNSEEPIGLYRLANGKTTTGLKLFKLPAYTKPKYSIEQIQNHRQ